ncbi:MAG: TM0106 family RecB-like putative nuclease [Cyanobacteria bacterium P01_H01_bin.15]
MLISDRLLLNFKRCQRRAYLNQHRRQPPDSEREFVTKLREESRRHSDNFVETYYPDHIRVTPGHPIQKATETLTLMVRGIDCIYQGQLRCFGADMQSWLDLDCGSNLFDSRPSLLVKEPGNSRFGPWQYRNISIQLGRRAKSEYKLVAAFQSYVLASIQETAPLPPDIVLRDHHRHQVQLSYKREHLQEMLTAILSSLAQTEPPEVFISRQRCSLCRWYSDCYAEATQNRHLSLVPGVTPQRYAHLRTLEIESVAALATASPLQTGELLGYGFARQLQQQAAALHYQRPFLRQPDKPPPIFPNAEVELFFDIEAEPERNVDYLWGVLFVENSCQTAKFKGFVAEAVDEEEQTWLNFLNFVQTYPNAPIYHYSAYEIEAVRKLGQRYRMDPQIITDLLTRFVDVHHHLVNTVTLPVENYSLKTLANWLGFQWRDPEANGEVSVCWYDRWLKEGNREYLERIIDYNEDDCRATWHLKTWLTEFWGTADSLNRASS